MVKELNERVYKSERKRKRVISFNKLRYFCLSLFYHDSAERERAKIAREIDGLLFIVYFLPPKTVFKDITNIY